MRRNWIVWHIEDRAIRSYGTKLDMIAAAERMNLNYQSKSHIQMEVDDGAIPSH